jgi:hypothetical protein
MRCRPIFAVTWAASLAATCVAITPRVHGQAATRGLVDGYTFGIGIAVYQGDLDRNPDNQPAQFIASGSLHVVAGVDRQLGGGRFGVELHYNRLLAENLLVSGSHNVVSLDLTYGRPIGRSPVIAFVGVGPSIIVSSYERPSVAAEVLGIANEGAGFDVTIPFGVIIQDRVRLSTRIALLDRVDGTDVLGGRDLISNISIAYRFARGR